MRLSRLLTPFMERPLVTAALLYGTGILLGGILEPGAYLYIAIAGAVVCIAALKLLGLRMLAGGLTLCLCVGMLAGSLSVHVERPPEGDYTITGVVRDDALMDENNRMRMYLTDVVLTDASGAAWRTSGAYLTYYASEGEEPPCDGLRVRTTGSVYHPAGRVNPYGFDFARFLLLRGASIGVYARELPVDAGGVRADFAYAMRRVRDTLSGLLDTAMGEPAILARTMLLGDREGMPDELRDAFTRLGIAHILAVSGLHIGFVLFPFLLLGGLLRNRWVHFALCATVLAFYCALVGFTASVLRASLLWCLYALGRNLWRPYDKATALALAFLIILLIRPLDLYSASFQLTFCALGGILVLFDPLKARLDKLPPHPKHRAFKVIRSGCLNGFCLSISAMAGVSLPLATLYNELSIAGVIVSPLACGAAFVLILLYMATVVVMLIHPSAGMFLGAAASTLSQWFLDAVAWLDGLIVGTIRIPTPNLFISAAVVFCIILVSRYVLIKPRNRVLLALSSIALAVTLTILTTPGDVRYIQLSVGQSDAAVLEDGDYTCVIDTGTDGSELTQYLLATGRSVDYLVVTHLHDDHAGGLDMLLSSGVPVGVVFLPDAPVEDGNEYLAVLKASGIPISYMSAGDTLKSKRTTLTALWPVKGTARATDNLNHYSLTLLADVEGASMLLTGDLTNLYERYAAVPADVLKVAHHGSASSSEGAFLDIVNPQIALLSCSDNNALPAPSTLERFAARPSIHVYRTNETGALTLTFHGGKITVESYLPVITP